MVPSGSETVTVIKDVHRGQSMIIRFIEWWILGMAAALFIGLVLKFVIGVWGFFFSLLLSSPTSKNVVAKDLEG
jgi:hypothetical protein